MCGILCLITKLQVDPLLYLPEGLINQAQDGANSKDDIDEGDSIPGTITYANDIKVTSWESKGSELDIIIQKSLDACILSPSDISKLANLDRLRELDLQMSKVKNNVKITKEVKESKIGLLVDEMNSLTMVKDTPDVSKDDILQTLIQKVAARGPDYLGYNSFSHSNRNFHIFSSLLSLRLPFQKQPIHFDRYVLQFNGELYNPECLEVNDTQLIMKKLIECDGDVLLCICQLSGEFAFVIHDLVSDTIYFGRDCIGKRSLCYSVEEDQICISSVPLEGFIDCENLVYLFKLETFEVLSYSYPGLYRDNNKLELVYTSLKCDVNASGDLFILRQKLQECVNVRQIAIHPQQRIQGDEGQIGHIEKGTHSQGNKLDTGNLKYGVLFSGGLDCTIIAAMLCENELLKRKRDTEKRQSESILCDVYCDLISVSFDNPRTGQSSANSPDRLLAKKSYKELAAKFNAPNFEVRLVEIDVPYSLWLSHRQRVLDLIYPHDTEMDLSIGIAFYFASSKIPAITTITDTTGTHADYDSNAKVLFSGLGADELFGGYSRHESIFTNNLSIESTQTEIENAYGKLSDELIHDIHIIHSRNLSRDDRVVASWGKELRYPYLDVEFIQYVINQIEPNLKVKYEWKEKLRKKKNSTPDTAQGKQEFQMVPTRKHLLRELAENIGLDWVKNEPKRAIQFGAKSAKMEIGQGKVKGDYSVR